jgi:hypothetical protein
MSSWSGSTLKHGMSAVDSEGLSGSLLLLLDDGWHFRCAMAIWVAIGSLAGDGAAGDERREGTDGLAIRNLVPSGSSGGGGTVRGVSAVQSSHAMLRYSLKSAAAAVSVLNSIRSPSPCYYSVGCARSCSRSW